MYIFVSFNEGSVTWNVKTFTEYKWKKWHVLNQIAHLCGLKQFIHVFDYENGRLAKKKSLVFIIGREETCQIIRALRVLKVHLLWNWPSIQGKFEIDCEVGCKF